MTEPPIDEEIRKAELDRIKAETLKYRSEAQDSSRTKKTVFWSEIIKIVGAVIIGGGGIIAAITQHELAALKAQNAKDELEEVTGTLQTVQSELDAATKKKNQALDEQKEIEQSVSELRNELASLTSTVNEAKPALIEKRLVYVQFRGSLTRALINTYREQLAESGFNAPGAERRSGDYGNIVKYFDTDDSDEAQELVDATQKFFKEKGCPLTIDPTFINTSKHPAPPLEVWIHHKCN